MGLAGRAAHWPPVGVQLGWQMPQGVQVLPVTQSAEVPQAPHAPR